MYETDGDVGYDFMHGQNEGDEFIYTSLSKGGDMPNRLLHGYRIAMQTQRSFTTIRNAKVLPDNPNALSLSTKESLTLQAEGIWQDPV